MCQRPREKVESACLACKSAHAKCAYERPCPRCKKLGLRCVSKGESKKRPNLYSEIDFSKKRRIEPNLEQAYIYQQYYATGYTNQFNDTFNVEELFAPDPLLYCNTFSPLSFKAPESPSDTMDSQKSGIIVAMSSELPDFKIWSPNLKQKLGFSELDNYMSLEKILGKEEVDIIMNNLYNEIEQRKMLKRVNGSSTMFKYCLETSSIEKKTLFCKDGTPLECVIKFVKSFSKFDPLSLESFTMYVFWN